LQGNMTVGQRSATGTVGYGNRPEIAQKIGHGGRLEQFRRSQRPSAYSADLLLELTRATGVERQMPRVVRTRRDLVDQQASVFGEEKFNAQHPDVVEALKDRPGDV